MKNRIKVAGGTSTIALSQGPTRVNSLSPTSHVRPVYASALPKKVATARPICPGELTSRNARQNGRGDEPRAGRTAASARWAAGPPDARLLAVLMNDDAR